MSEFLKDIAKMNEYGGIVDDGVETGDVASFIDTLRGYTSLSYCLETPILTDIICVGTNK